MVLNSSLHITDRLQSRFDVKLPPKAHEAFIWDNQSLLQIACHYQNASRHCKSSLAIWCDAAIVKMIQGSEISWKTASYDPLVRILNCTEAYSPIVVPFSIAACCGFRPGNHILLFYPPHCSQWVSFRWWHSRGRMAKMNTNNCITLLFSHNSLCMKVFLW